MEMPQQYSEMMKQQKEDIRTLGVAFEKMVSTPEWQHFQNAIEIRASAVMKSILAPAQGQDGMGIALSSERLKGALAELQFMLSYPHSIVKMHNELRQGSEENNQ